MIIIFDRKQDFYDIAMDYSLLYFFKEDFHDNWCQPPSGVEATLWYNILSEILVSLFELRIGAQGLLIEILTSHKQPNLYSVVDSLQQYEKSAHKDTALRLKYRLEWLLTVLGSTAASKHTPDWNKLTNSGFALNISGLSSSVQALCITIYFAKLLLYRICNNLRTDKLETLFVLDEASVIFPKSATKKTSLLLDYFQQARAFGIGVIFASQSMNLAPEIYANTSIKICIGGFGHGSDYSEFASAVGLSKEQSNYMRRLQNAGSAVIKDIRYPHPFTVQIDKPVEIKNISIEDVRKLSKQS